MSGGSKGGGTTVTETRIPGELKPLASAQGRIGADALNALNANLARNPERLVTPFTPEQERGFDLAEAAVTGNGIIPEVTNQLQGTARGDFLFGNPAFDEAVQASIRAAQPQILSTFGRAGGTPGGLAQAAIQQAASDAFANLFSQERARQMQAQLALPQLALIPSDVLSSIGAQRQALQLSQQLAPVRANQMLLEASGAGIPLSALLGRAQTAPRGSGNSALATGLGAAATAASLFGSFGGGGRAMFSNSAPMSDAQWAGFLASH